MKVICFRYISRDLREDKNVTTKSISFNLLVLTSFQHTLKIRKFEIIFSISVDSQFLNFEEIKFRDQQF